VLLALQIFWGYLIVKVAVKLAIHGHADDPRSDDEAEVTDEEKKKKH
jgi:hypothetical protein